MPQSGNGRGQHQTKSTTKRGLGWDHQRQRQRLLADHVDGSPCPCLGDPADPCGPGCICRPVGHGRPMFRSPARNPDGMALEADHTLARSRGGTKADRLMLATCNRSRGAGRRQEARLTGGPRPWWSRTWFGDGA